MEVIGKSSEIKLTEHFLVGRCKSPLRVRLSTGDLTCLSRRTGPALCQTSVRCFEGARLIERQETPLGKYSGMRDIKPGFYSTCVDTMEEKRKTVQIRISRRWHEFLKKNASERHRRISEVADEMASRYSGEYARERKEHEARMRAFFGGQPKMPRYGVREEPGEPSLPS